MQLVKQRSTTNLCRHPSEILPQQKNWNNFDCKQLLCWAMVAIECHCNGTSFWRTLEGYHLDKGWELEEDEQPTISKPQEFLEIALWAVEQVREAEGDPYLVRHPVMMLPQQDWQKMSENQMLTWCQVCIETYQDNQGRWQEAEGRRGNPDEDSNPNQPWGNNGQELLKAEVGSEPSARGPLPSAFPPQADNEWSVWKTMRKYDDEVSDYLGFTDEDLLLPRAELLEIAEWTINRQWCDAIGLEYPAHLNTPGALKARFRERFEKALQGLKIQARHRSDLVRLHSDRVFYKQGCTQVEIEHILKPYYHFDLLGIAEEISRNLEVLVV